MLDRVPTGAATFEARSLNVASVLEFVGSMFCFMLYRIYITKRACQPLVCCLSQCAAFHLSRIPSGSSQVTLRKPSVVHRRYIGTENLWSESPPISGRTAGRGRIPTTRMLCGSSAPRHDPQRHSHIPQEMSFSATIAPHSHE